MWRNLSRLIVSEAKLSRKPVQRTLTSAASPEADPKPGSSDKIQVEENDSSAEVAAPRLTDTLHQRFVYPEFLPDPDFQKRNTIREKLERTDMMKRRSQVDLPEFYVGSILAVTSANKHSASQQNRFLGICIKREGCGLRAYFILRNVIDNIGVEIKYFLYDPKISKIDVIRLEKRLDDELYYLRDALPEFSTFKEDMEIENLPDGAPVPINTTKVIMKPRPWYARWERTSFEGIDRASIMSQLSEKMVHQIQFHQKPWEKYDLMKTYRNTIPEEEQAEIFAEVDSELHKLEILRKKQKRKRSLVKTKRVV